MSSRQGINSPERQRRGDQKRFDPREIVPPLTVNRLGLLALRLSGEFDVTDQDALRLSTFPCAVARYPDNDDLHSNTDTAAWFEDTDTRLTPNEFSTSVDDLFLEGDRIFVPRGVWLAFFSCQVRNTDAVTDGAYRCAITDELDGSTVNVFESNGVNVAISATAGVWAPNLLAGIFTFSSQQELVVRAAEITTTTDLDMYRGHLFLLRLGGI